jgi:hypothetical protein
LGTVDLFPRRSRSGWGRGGVFVFFELTCGVLSDAFESHGTTFCDGAPQ